MSVANRYTVRDWYGKAACHVARQFGQSFTLLAIIREARQIRRLSVGRQPHCISICADYCRSSACLQQVVPVPVAVTIRKLLEPPFVEDTRMSSPRRVATVDVSCLSDSLQRCWYSSQSVRQPVGP